MEEKVGITLDQKQVLELEEIVIDRDKEAAVQILHQNVAGEK